MNTKNTDYSDHSPVPKGEVAKVSQNKHNYKIHEMPVRLEILIQPRLIS